MTKQIKFRTIRKNIIEISEYKYSNNSAKQALLFFSLHNLVSKRLRELSENQTIYRKSIVKNVAYNRSNIIDSNRLLHLL